MQDIFNLLPNTNTADLAKAFAVQTNDMMVVVYLSALIRSVIALHNLVNNRSAPLRGAQRFTISALQTAHARLGSPLPNSSRRARTHQPFVARAGWRIELGK
eukprot:COSAG02_NODE_5682_length_4131_cov_2.988591_3_plen_102_part_00